MGPRNKKIILSKHVAFDETSLLKSTISQQVKRLKTKNVSQRIEVDSTPPPDDSASVEISLSMTPCGDNVAGLDAEQVEGKVDLIAVEGTKKSPQKWVVKKRGSQIGEVDQLKLKAIILHNGIGKEIHITPPVEFVVADLKTIDLVA